MPKFKGKCGQLHLLPIESHQTAVRNTTIHTKHLVSTRKEVIAGDLNGNARRLLLHLYCKLGWHQRSLRAHRIADFRCGLKRLQVHKHPNEWTTQIHEANDRYRATINDYWHRPNSVGAATTIGQLPTQVKFSRWKPSEADHPLWTLNKRWDLERPFRYY